jgi:hypothetical protein
MEQTGRRQISNQQNFKKSPLYSLPLNGTNWKETDFKPTKLKKITPLLASFE